jgi:hypothetical protein
LNLSYTRGFVSNQFKIKKALVLSKVSEGLDYSCVY